MISVPDDSIAEFSVTLLKRSSMLGEISGNNESPIVAC